MPPDGYEGDDPSQSPERATGDPSLFDELFVAGAQFREETAAERAARGAQERREQREGQRRDKREARRRRLASRFGGRRRVLSFALLGAAVLATVWLGKGGDSSEQAAGNRPPTNFQVTYAPPADVRSDPGAIAAIRGEIGITSRWLTAQTGGRTLRFVEAEGEVAVDERRLAIKSTDLAQRADAISLVNDEFRSSDDDEKVIRVVFTPVRFREQVRCGESQGERFIVVWMGSCGLQPSVKSRAFGDGTTTAIAHEIVHALGAVEPCAPHYGRNGHVVDDPTDLMYDGPDAAPLADRVLDPGHDDYFEHGNAKCWDVADHPAWRK